MDVIIAESDAIRTYRLARKEAAPVRVEPTREVPANFIYGSSRSFGSKVIPILTKLGIVAHNNRVHLRFPSLVSRRRLDGVAVHISSTPLPPESFWRIVPAQKQVAQELAVAGVRLFVDSPQLCVLSAAAHAQRVCGDMPLTQRIVPLGRTIACASELCGLYALDPFNPRGGRPSYGCEPLISNAELNRFLSDVTNVDGVRIARTAGSFVADGQGSPAEVALHAGLTLSPRLGGFHLERPTANRSMNLSAQQQSCMKHDNITPDLYWERYGLVIEYDGSDHFTVEGAREDKRRIYDYQTLGLTVLPATWEDVRSVDAFDSFVRVVTRVMERKDGPSLRRRINKILASKDARSCRSLLLSAIQTAA